MRKSFILLLSPFLLFGCGRSADKPVFTQTFSPELRAPMPDTVVANNANNTISTNALFSYMHTLMLEMPHAGVEPRYERARQRCLHDAMLSCKLISASFDKQEGETGLGYSAQLVVALPHDKIAAYEKDLVSPVGGSDAATITSSTTAAQNVTQDAATAGLKVAQLSDYRDRLLALLKRPNLSVDDLIKVEGELAKTQSDLDEALSQKTDIDDRVAREQMSITLGEKPGIVSPLPADRQCVETFRPDFERQHRERLGVPHRVSPLAAADHRRDLSHPLAVEDCAAASACCKVRSGITREDGTWRKAR